MQAQLSAATLATMIKRYTPEQRAQLNNNLKIPPLSLDKWLKKPDATDILTVEHIQQLADWCLGNYVHVSSKEGYILLEPKPRPSGELGHAPRATGSGNVYGHPSDSPNVPLGMKVARAALRGAELPTLDDAKIAKAKADEAQAIAAAKKAKSPMRRAAETILMRPIQH